MAASLSGMIVQSVEDDKILDKVREGSRGNRLLVVEKRDLQNIAAEFGLTKDHMRHPDDSASVWLIATEMDEAGEVLYFKDEGNIDPDNPDISEEVFIFWFMKGQEKKKAPNEEHW